MFLEQGWIAMTCKFKKPILLDLNSDSKSGLKRHKSTEIQT